MNLPVGRSYGRLGLALEGISGSFQADRRWRVFQTEEYSRVLGCGNKGTTSVLVWVDCKAGRRDRGWEVRLNPGWTWLYALILQAADSHIERRELCFNTCHHYLDHPTVAPLDQYFTIGKVLSTHRNITLEWCGLKAPWRHHTCGFIGIVP